MLRFISASVLLTPILLIQTTHRFVAIGLESGQTISIQFDNGSPPIKAGEEVPKAEQSFLLSPQESFAVGGGSSFFSFADFPEGVTQVKFLLEVNPGNRVLNLSLPGGYHLTTEKAEKMTVWVSEGEALSIAYGYDQHEQQFASTTFTLLDD